MKSLISSTLDLGTFAGVILAGGQMPDGSCCILWTLGWLAFAATCAIVNQKIVYKNRRA